VHGAPAVEALLADGPRVVKTGDDVALEVRGTRIVAARWPGGGRIEADVFVCCAGWRTPHLLRPLGVTIPLIAADEPGSPAPCLVLRTSGPALVSRVVNAPTLSLRPLLRRGIQLEGTEADDGVDAGTPPATLDRLAAGLLARTGQMLTGFDAGETAHRVCIRPLPVDGHPIVGWLPGLANTYVIVTHSGMTLAAVLARLAATEILTDQPAAELEPYGPARFPA
jgi:glycine/D-amino acid oxidase-like deaminating enzyme